MPMQYDESGAKGALIVHIAGGAGTFSSSCNFQDIIEQALRQCAEGRRTLQHKQETRVP